MDAPLATQPSRAKEAKNNSISHAFTSRTNLCGLILVKSIFVGWLTTVVMISFNYILMKRSQSPLDWNPKQVGSSLRCCSRPNPYKNRDGGLVLD